MIKILKHGYSTVYVHKESGNLYVKDKQGKSRPIQYGVYDSDQSPVGLKDYMNIKGIDIHKALEELESCNVVFLSNTFSIAFYEEEDMEKFMQVMAS